MIQDFEWYISVLMDFVENGNFSESSGTLLAQQFTELAYRVPDQIETCRRNGPHS